VSNVPRYASAIAPSFFALPINAKARELPTIFSCPGGLPGRNGRWKMRILSDVTLRAFVLLRKASFVHFVQL
jgi:hypothetical protein